MAMMGYWLALRFLPDPAARATLQAGFRDGFYARPGKAFQPRDHGYAFYDLTAAAWAADASAFGLAASAPDPEAMARGLSTLAKFREPPYWSTKVVNCPVYEVHDCSVNANDAGLCSWDPALFAEPCVASDGVTLLELLGCGGWKCNGVASEALPWELVPPSNYHWRSSPHDVNGGDDGSGLLPGVDFRFAYWMGRWTAL
jgi:hypothetical protein